MNRILLHLSLILGIALVLIANSSWLHAQGSAGGNDTSFNPLDVSLPSGDGSGSNDWVAASAIQPDGKLLIAGWFTSYNGLASNHVARLNADGSLDASFSSGSGIGGAVRDLLVQPDGKILIAGEFSSYNGIPRNNIARLNANGTLDPTFNPGTAANYRIRKMALMGDGRIVIGGSFTQYNGTNRARIARLMSDGSLDASFDPGAGPDNEVLTVAVLSDGRVMIGGAFYLVAGLPRNRIARLMADGSLDQSLNVGLTTGNEVRTIVVQQDGKMLIGGDFEAPSYATCLVRIHPDGTEDTSFNGPFGPLPNLGVQQLALQADGKILYLGNFFGSLRRLNPDGSGDSTFDPGSGMNGSAISLCLQPDGKSVIAGLFTQYDGLLRGNVARVNTDGSLDRTFNPRTGANSTVYSVAFQSDGKQLIGGDFNVYNDTDRRRIARITADGEVDPSFNPNTGADGSVYAIVPQPDGKILIGGNFSTYSGTSRSRIGRLNPDGSLDAGFNPGVGVNGPLFQLQLQPDGKVLIGGEFTTFNGTARNRIARLSASGSLDASFNPGTGANGPILSMALQSDGKVLIGGEFTTFNGTARNRIARLNANGSLDTGFNPGSGANGSVNALLVQQDGTVLIGGNFTGYNGAARNRIARLSATGSLDAGFNPGSGANASVLAIGIQPDGKVLLAGDFTSYNGTVRNRAARANIDGSLDAGYQPGSGGSNFIYAIRLQPDGRVMHVGGFTSYDGAVRSRIARVFAYDPFVEFCSGDGSAGAACPCANVGLADRGCNNSAATGGARLDGQGLIPADAVTFTASGLLPTALTIFLQGTATLAAPAVFGDGLRCVGGSLKRLYVKSATGGVAAAPAGGDPSVKTQSAALGDPIAPGATRFYQAYYRDANAAFCPTPNGGTFNISNGLRVLWY